MKCKSIIACITALLTVCVVQAEERFVPLIFMKAKLLGMSLSNGRDSLNYQFLIQDDFGTMSWISSDVRCLPSRLSKEDMLELFEGLSETNYMARTSSLLPKGVSFGSTVLVYARLGSQSWGIQEMILYSLEAEKYFMNKHEALLKKTQEHMRQENIRGQDYVMRTLARELESLENILNGTGHPDLKATTQAKLVGLRARIKDFEERFANKQMQNIGTNAPNSDL